MIQALYTASTGAKNLQNRIDTVSNNVVNINTDGFKASRVGFKDALYQTMRSPLQPQGGANLQLGSGMLTSDTTINFRKGAIRGTQEMLDFALEGDGFFSVQNAQGQTRFTRNGAFAISTEAGGNYLVTKAGDYVLDENGKRMELAADTMDIECSQDGLLTDHSGNVLGRLGIVRFDNPEGLQKAGDNLYSASNVSGAARADADPKVRQRALEGSNVDLGEEMTKLIRAQRAYTLISRAITTADQMESAANNLRK